MPNRKLCTDLRLTNHCAVQEK